MFKYYPLRFLFLFFINRIQNSKLRENDRWIIIEETSTKEIETKITQSSPVALE